MIPINFKTLRLYACDDTLDPKEHMVVLNTMSNQWSERPSKMQYLLGTFKMAALTWFTNLHLHKIMNFTKFSHKFLTQFSVKQAHQVTLANFFKFDNNQARP